jgi:hypothetical protein
MRRDELTLEGCRKLHTMDRNVLWTRLNRQSLPAADSICSAEAEDMRPKCQARGIPAAQDIASAGATHLTGNLPELVIANFGKDPTQSMLHSR